MKVMDIDYVKGSLHFRQNPGAETRCMQTGRAERVALPDSWAETDVVALAALCEKQLERIRLGYGPKLVSLQESRGELTDDARAALGEIKESAK